MPLANFHRNCLREDKTHALCSAVEKLIWGSRRFWASVRHLQRLLEMGSGGKTSHALYSGGQTSHALWHDGESSHAKRHGL